LKELLMSILPGNSSTVHSDCHHHQSSLAGSSRTGGANAIAVAHAAAFALQGLLLALFLGLNARAATGLFLGFVVMGVGLGILWKQWAAMPHWLDMCFSMCTVGCCGMFLGIWTDHQFGPIASIESMFWTYGFMLVACNVGMFAMTRCRHAFSWTDVAFLAMVIGGNLGMIVGMRAGMLAVTQLVDAAQPIELLGKLAGMSLGMVIGMLLGNMVFLVLARRVVELLSHPNAEPKATSGPREENGAIQTLQADPVVPADRPHR
jgi:hypothetical protein